MLSIMRPLPVSAIASGSGSVAVVHPEYLLTPDPKEAATVAFTTNGQTAKLNIDMGATVSLDTAFVGFSSLPLGSAFTAALYAANSSYVPGGALLTLTPADSVIISPRPHLYGQFVSTASRYWVLQINDVTGGARAAQFGALALGQSFTPVYGREYGSGRGVIDGGSVSRNQAGGFAVDPGAIAADFAWTLGDLTDTEVQQLFAIAMDRGETNSVLVVEDSDNSYAGLGDRIHWGLFSKFERYARFAPGATRWGLSISDWA